QGRRRDNLPWQSWGGVRRVSMQRAHVGATWLLVQLFAAPPTAAVAATAGEVDVIVSRPDPTQAQTPAHKRLSVHGFFNLVKRTAASLTGYALPLTKCEKVSVPRDKLDAVKRAAARRGLLV